MEYIVALLIVALIVVLYMKKGDKVYDAVIDNLTTKLREKEAEIVWGLYNKLPKAIKDKVDSKTIADIVSFAIGIVADVLGKKESTK